MFQCRVEHSKWNLNQLHCLNNINKVRNRRKARPLKICQVKYQYFHLPFLHNSYCSILSLPINRKVRCLCLPLAFDVEQHSLWNSCQKFAKNMIYFLLSLLALWRVIKIFIQELNQTSWKFLKDLIIWTLASFLTHDFTQTKKLIFYIKLRHKDSFL